MSDEPVAKRTRSQTETTGDREDMYREIKTLCETMMSTFHQVIHFLPEVNRIANATKDLVSKPEIHCQLREIENNVKTNESYMKCAQKSLFEIEQHVDHLLVERLHKYDCTESEECLLRMQEMLIRNPLSLERKQTIRESTGELHKTREHKHSPLHDAIMRGHVKCVKFLLERGANVSSLTTFEEDTVLHTLYINTYRLTIQERLDILKLLLNHGVSRIFQHKEAGTIAIKAELIFYESKEVSLLFQHGATMSLPNNHLAIATIWSTFDLSLVKLFLLCTPNKVNPGPGSPTLCQDLIHHCYRKMVMADMPSDVCQEKLVEVLRFYKAFGGKFNVCPWRDPSHDVLWYLQKSCKHCKYFNAAMSRIKAIISNPLSLKEASRLVVRKRIGGNYIENIKGLNVSEEIQHILRFDDVTITELPSTFESNGDCDNVSSGDSVYRCRGWQSDSSDESNHTVDFEVHNDSESNDGSVN